MPEPILARHGKKVRNPRASWDFLGRIGSKLCAALGLRNGTNGGACGVVGVGMFVSVVLIVMIAWSIS